MREIKFRWFDTKYKKMLYDEVTIVNPSGILTCSIPLDIGIPMQYTGIKDKNGKEIYEGDIYHNGDTNIKYKVKFDECQFIGQQIGNESAVGLPYWIDRTEVIGNIHESPELLGKIGI